MRRCRLRSAFLATAMALVACGDSAGVASYDLPAPAGLIGFHATPGLAVDPPDARFQIVANLTTTLDPAATETGEVRLGSRLIHPAPEAGDTLVQLWYVDRDVTVAGSAGGCTHHLDYRAG